MKKMWWASLWAAALGALCACEDSARTRHSPPHAPVIADRSSAAALESAHVSSAHAILAKMEALETRKDVTCWSSFRQLDSFLATLQYSDHATLAKISAVKMLARRIWILAASRTPTESVTAEDLKRVIRLRRVPLPEERADALGEDARGLADKSLKDYQTTSEHWRVLLSVVQGEILHRDPLKPLAAGAEEVLADMVSSLSLELLVSSGERARKHNAKTIEVQDVRAAYEDISSHYKLPEDARPAVRKSGAERLIKPLTQRLIQAKIKALRSYNRSSGSLVEDFQRISALPMDRAAILDLKRMVGTMATTVSLGREPMRADNFLSSAGIAPHRAREEGRSYIDALYAENAVMQLFPHALQANGDVMLRFAPNPSRITGQKDLGVQDIRLLEHQMNAVRDTAVHWLVMEEVFQKHPFAMDPFAAEYLSEALSIMMTLYVRRAQTVTRQRKAERVTVASTKRVLPGGYVLVTPVDQRRERWGEREEAQKKSILQALPGERFRDITGASGLPTALPDEALAPRSGVRGVTDIQDVMGAGIAVGDINRDHFPDVFIAGEGMGKLYLNGGKRAPGTFRDVTSQFGLTQDMGDSRGALFFDRDGDGDLDLLVLKSGGGSLLLDRDGDRFSNVAANLGFLPGKGAHTASVFDADGDGDLDIFVGRYGSDACARRACGKGQNLPSLHGRNGASNELWLFEEGRYVESASRAGLADTGWTLASGTFDQDMDGDLDLYLANDFGANALFRNEGQGRFVEVAQKNGTADRGSGMNVSFSDVNEDGLWDLYVTNIDMFSKNIKIVYPRGESTMGLDDAVLTSFRYLSGNKLYLSQKDAPETPFVNAELASFEPGDRGWAWAGSFFDLENDGDEDMYLSNGWLEGSFAGNQENQLLVREGEVFVRAPRGPESFAGNSRSVAILDVDQDGDQDVLINNFMQPPRLLENVQHRGHAWLKFWLRGEKSNRQAIGARVEIRGEKLRLMRQVTCGIDYLGQAEELLHVGLGQEKTVDVRVIWPDHAISEKRGVRAGQVLEIRHPNAP